MLPLTSCGSLDKQLKDVNLARPCTRVRILPFHLTCYQINYSHKEPACFRSRRHCSHLYDFSRRVLPATRLQFLLGVFGLSSPTKARAIIMLIYYTTKTKKSVMWLWILWPSCVFQQIQPLFQLHMKLQSLVNNFRESFLELLQSLYRQLILRH